MKLLFHMKTKSTAKCNKIENKLSYVIQSYFDIVIHFTFCHLFFWIHSIIAYYIYDVFHLTTHNII